MSLASSFLYSAARVGAGIPRPNALITKAGGEYPPLRARYGAYISS
jgi:hypothetical protein